MLTDELVRFIRLSTGLSVIIESSPIVFKTFSGRGRRKSQSQLAFNEFWKSPEGVKFRIKLQEELGHLALGLLQGPKARAKKAVFEIIVRLRLEKGLEA